MGRSVTDATLLNFKVIGVEPLGFTARIFPAERIRAGSPQANRGIGHDFKASLAGPLRKGKILCQIMRSSVPRLLCPVPLLYAHRQEERPDAASKSRIAQRQLQPVANCLIDLAADVQK